MMEQFPTYPDLVGKVAVVTGGSRGIGAATARLLARSGGKVAVNGRDETAIENVVSGIRADGGEAVGAAANLTDFDAVGRCASASNESLALRTCWSLSLAGRAILRQR